MLDEEGRTRMKLKVENTIRWRTLKDDDGNDLKDENGKPVRESNARVVRWSDGRYVLVQGGGQLFACGVTLSGFRQALEIMENLENHPKKFHAWKNH